VRFSTVLQPDTTAAATAGDGHLSVTCVHVWKGKPPAFIEKIISFSDAVKRDEFDTTRVRRKLRGKISSIINERAGSIRFKLDKKFLDASFDVDDLWGLNLPLTSALLNTPVVFDVERQVGPDNRGVCYKALQVREDIKVNSAVATQLLNPVDQVNEAYKHENSTEAEKMPEDAMQLKTSKKWTEEQLCRDIDEVLEPAEVTEWIALDASGASGPNAAVSADLAGLPPVVASIFQAVFDQDEDDNDNGMCHMILSNPVAIDVLLNKIPWHGPQIRACERSQLKLEIEKAARKVVSQFLVRRDTN